MARSIFKKTINRKRMVIAIFLYVIANKTEDLSDRCTRGRQINLHLTSGVGFGDNSVAVILKKGHLNCSIKYYVKKDDFIVTMMHFSDLSPDHNICIQEGKTSFMVSDLNKSQECKNISLSPECSYSKVSKETLVAQFNNLNNINTVTITATSMRDSSQYNCFAGKEVKCTVNNESYCMTDKTACDKIVYCESEDVSVNDFKNCKELILTPFIIINSIIMLVLTFLIWLIIFITLAPKRKEIFVYQFDQLMPLYDCESGDVNYEVDIKVLFPPENLYTSRSKPKSLSE